MAETIVSPGVFQRENDISFIAPAPLEAGAAIIGPTVKGPVEVPTTVTSYSEYVRKFGDTFETGSEKSEFLTSLAVKSYFQQGGDTCLITRVVTGSFTAATDEGITAADAGAAPFTIETLGKGVIMNNSGAYNSDNSLVLGNSDNVRWEISNISNAKGTFTLSVRRGDDNHKNKIVLESFNNLTLDPNADNYIAKVIGNQTTSKGSDGTTKYVSVTGDYVNNSNYIRVASVPRQTLNYTGNDGLIRVGSASGSLPTAHSGSFKSATGANVVTGIANNYFGDINTRTQGLTTGCYTDAIAILENTDAYLFNVISAPGLVYDKHTTPIDSIISLTETRGDCIAVIDLYSYGATISNVTGKADLLNSSYAATYWPWLQTASATGKNVWAPASTFIPGVYAFTDGAAAPWFAPAGLTRGGVPGVIQAERKLTRNDRDTLYESKVNPIATFPGTGIAIFGQKTLQTKASALDRVNVRRLLIDLKKFIGDQASTLVFEQNTITTRNKFLSAVNPYLDSVTQRQGLYTYRVVMDDSNNTADV